MIISKIFLTGSWSMFRPAQWLYKSRQWPDLTRDPEDFYSPNILPQELWSFLFQYLLWTQSVRPLAQINPCSVSHSMLYCHSDGRIKDAFRNWQLILVGLSGLSGLSWASIKSKHFQSEKTIDCNTGGGSSQSVGQTESDIVSHVINVKYIITRSFR